MIYKIKICRLITRIFIFTSVLFYLSMFLSINFLSFQTDNLEISVGSMGYCCRNIDTDEYKCYAEHNYFNKSKL